MKKVSFFKQKNTEDDYYLDEFIKYTKICSAFLKTGSLKICATHIAGFLSLQNISISFDPLNSIPRNGPLAFVCNHPFGFLDSLVLFYIIHTVRPDIQIVDFHESNADILDQFLFPFTLHSTSKNSSLDSKIAEHFLQEKSLIFFPDTNKNKKDEIDTEWDKDIISLIKTQEVPIIPLHIRTNKNKSFLLYSKKNKRFTKDIYISIGIVIKNKEIQEFTNNNKLSRYLRACSFLLGHNKTEIKTYFEHINFRKLKKEELIHPPIQTELLCEEIEKIRKTALITSHKEFEVFTVSAVRIPFIMAEIGRLREITFRQIGEGTFKNLDLDEFDLYYEHLFIWDSLNKKIVGAYRIGMGKDIMQQYGKHGFYIHTLFKIKNEFTPVLEKSIELGRSFIVPEYQKHPLSLFLLWRGILCFLIQHPQYKFLIGPVSISNEFSDISKSLIVSFITSYHFDYENTQFFTARKKYKIPGSIYNDIHDIVENVDIKKLDKHIESIEKNLRIPVLLKKYLSLNAKIICFNRDPHFNNCLDGLVFLDIDNIPVSAIHVLSKDILHGELLQNVKIQT